MKAMSRREGSDTLFLTLDWHIALLSLAADGCSLPKTVALWPQNQQSN